MANKSKLFKSQAEDITDSMFSADVIQSRSDSEEKPDKAEAAVSEKPAKKPESKPAAEKAEAVTEVVEPVKPKEPGIEKAEKKPEARAKRAVSFPVKPKNSVKSKSINRAEDHDNESSSKKTERPSIYMTKELLSEVKLASSMNGMNICSFVTMLIEDYIEKNKDKLDIFRSIYGNH